jgi:hypothetical protein
VTPIATFPREVLVRERPTSLRDQGAAQVALWEARVAQRGLSWEALGGTAAVAGVVSIAMCPFAWLGWKLVATVIAALGLGFPLLLSYIGLWLNRGPARRQLAEFEKDYHFTLDCLEKTGLGLLIAEDEVWQCLFESGVSAAARLIVQPPRSAAERLVYATLCWDLLVAYIHGQRSGFDFEVLARQPALRAWLGAKTLGELTNMLALARYCAIHDFFQPTVIGPA